MNNLTSLIVGALTQGAAALNQQQPPPPPPPPAVSYQPAVVTVAAPQQPFVVTQPAVMAQPQSVAAPATGYPQVVVPQAQVQSTGASSLAMPTAAQALPMATPSVPVTTALSASSPGIPPPAVSEPATSPVAPPVELVPGAMCRTYTVKLSRGRTYDRNRNRHVNEVLEQINAGAVALDQAYDAVSLDFNARRVNKHGGNLFVWDGFLVVERAGTYTFMLSGLQRGLSFAQVVVNREVGEIAHPRDTKTFNANLAKGANSIQLVVFGSDEAPVLEYRPASFVTTAKKITPSMLHHEAVEEEEW